MVRPDAIPDRKPECRVAMMRPSIDGVNQRRPAIGTGGSISMALATSGREDRIGSDHRVVKFEGPHAFRRYVDRAGARQARQQEKAALLHFRHQSSESLPPSGRTDLARPDGTQYTSAGFRCTNNSVARRSVEPGIAWARFVPSNEDLAER